MALQVWIPLDGSLRNLGTKSVTVTANSGIGYNPAGKIGQAFVGSGNKHIQVVGITLGTVASICCWSKTSFTGKAQQMWVLESTSSTHLNLDCTPNGSYYCLNTGDSNQNPFRTDAGTNITYLSDNLWHHFAVTFDGSSCLLYIDGEYAGKALIYKAPTTTSTKKITIAGGYDGGTVYDWQGEMNDFRVYDECLSAAEIKEIAKAMVCHYKLDDFTAGNLITNGYGRDGDNGWSTTVDSSDIPSVAGCEANVKTGWSYTRIPILHNEKYKLQLYIKASTTTNTYPSIEPIDDDGLRMAPWNVTGFHATARTTLSQELKPGDTVVHCTDLTNFSTTSYPYLAIFGYVSQHGKHYDDYTYTRDTPSITPANIDKTNNTIPLNAPYEGMYRPAGTAICQSASGAQYYYPVGGVNSNTASDWTLKEATFTPANVGFLKYATYMRYITYNGSAKVAAVRLSLVDKCNDISDTSGYGHDGIAHNLLDSSSIHNSNKIPELGRYDKCLTFASAATDYINAGRGGMVTDAITVSMWASMDTWNTQNPRFISCTESGGWNFEGGAAYSRATLCQNGTYINATSSKPFTSLSSGWHHFAQTYDGYTLEYYIDGQLEGSSATASSKLPITYNANNNIIIGGEANSSMATTPYFDGKISDVRIYATALSADDIKDLYSLSGRVDNLKNFHILKIIEKKNNHMISANISILEQKFRNLEINGLQHYSQANCQVTLENNAIHIYRPPNIDASAHNMWGGFRFRNDGNVLGLQKGRSYLWAMTVSGQTSNSPVIEVDNNMGWSGPNSGLMPQPTDIFKYRTPASFTGTQEAWYAFTIPDDIFKECTTGYSTFVTGKTYISYRDFQFRFDYTTTGTLGTDLYITNIRFFDITDLDLSNITRAGIANFTDFVEDTGIASINMNKEFYTNSIIEI